MPEAERRGDMKRFVESRQIGRVGWQATSETGSTERINARRLLQSSLEERGKTGETRGRSL
jgi:hypothetical protein